MFRYFYRIFDRYGEQIGSIAVLTERASGSADSRYEQKAFGSGVEFHYLTFNLMDYKKVQLLADQNPMVLVVLAVQERERLRQSDNRFDAKYLIRRLYERGCSREEIISLFKFIDWVIRLNADDEIRLRDELKTLEKVNRMPYVTSIERIGRQEGREEGLQQMVLEALDERFRELPETFSEAIQQIKDQEQWYLLHRQAIRCESLAEFQSTLNGN